MSIGVSLRDRAAGPVSLGGCGRQRARRRLRAEDDRRRRRPGHGRRRCGRCRRGSRGWGCRGATLIGPWRARVHRGRGGRSGDARRSAARGSGKATLHRRPRGAGAETALKRAAVGERGGLRDASGGRVLDVEAAHLELHLGVGRPAVRRDILGRRRGGGSEHRQQDNGRDEPRDDRSHRKASVAQAPAAADVGKCFHRDCRRHPRPMVIA